MFLCLVECFISFLCVLSPVTGHHHEKHSLPGWHPPGPWLCPEQLAGSSA